MLITDSSAYLSAELAAELDIRVVPLHVRLGDWAFDEPDIEPREFYRRLRDTEARPMTSQPSPGEFLAAFVTAANDGAQRLMCITCSATLSGTHASATLAAGMAPIPVDVVDSGTMSGGLALVVTSVGRALASGMAYDDALLLAGSLTGRVWSTWSSDTTDLLTAGGRLAADPADPADGVAVLSMEAGTVRRLGSAGTAEQSVALQAAVILAAAADHPSWVTVGHGDVPEFADLLAAALTDQPGVLGVLRYVIGPVTGAHTGAGTFGANYVVAGS